MIAITRHFVDTIPLLSQVVERVVIFYCYRNVGTLKFCCLEGLADLGASRHLDAISLSATISYTEPPFAFCAKA